MHALLVTLGTAGDVFPLLALGRALANRGHRVSVATLGRFRDLTREAGVDFVEIPEPPLTRYLTENPDVWKPAQGAKLVLSSFYAPAVSTVFRLVAEHAGSDTVVAATTLAFGARVAQEKLALPLATIHLQPAFFMSTAVPPPMATGFRIPAWVPPRLVQGLWSAAYGLLERVSLGEVRRFRAHLGLPRSPGLLTRWLHSPRRVLGFFPPWFGQPAPDWPPQTRLTGFLRYDRGEVEGLPAPVNAFVRAGSPPVVFTPGTAMADAGRFFDAAVDACRISGRRGILLTRHPGQVPPLPSSVAHFEYVPLSHLLPRAAALVHHGGIGSAAQSLAAGVPQVVTPFNYDQPDNALRLEGLGVGAWLRPSELDGERLAGTLDRLLRSEEVGTRCRDLAARVAADLAEETACRAIEELQP